MPYQHVLVAIDLTDECDPVMLRAQKLATSSAAKLSVVHIVEPMAMAFGGDVPMDLSMLQQQQFDQARERLDTFVKKHPEISSDKCHLAYGQPRQEIHRLAATDVTAWPCYWVPPPTTCCMARRAMCWRYA
jgi:universal stress protein A